jgi:molybdate transport system substrate-binding protein
MSSASASSIRRRALLHGIASVLLLAGVHATQSMDRPRPLTVAAAADLKFAMDDLLQDFRRTRPDLDVRVTYGSSGNFFAQISNGAPFDLLFSADMEYVRQLHARRLTFADTEFVYAVGRIVLWARRSAPFDLSRGAAVLQDSSVRRIAIANPVHAPYGRAAEAAMQSLQVYEDVRSKLVFGDNVAQAAQFVESGAADIGIIALSLAVSPTLMKEGQYWEIPLAAYPRMEQGGAVLRRTNDAEAARALTAFVRGPQGRAVLQRFGFLLPGS